MPVLTHYFRTYAGAGNDFVILNTYEAPLSLHRDEMTALVRKISSHNSGIGSDGVILINQSSIAPFGMAFYNPDGSYGALCGNGARCAVRAAKDFGLIEGPETDFEVLGAVNHAQMLTDDQVRVYFQDPVMIKLNFQLRIGKKEFIRTNYVDLGSQHAITNFEEVKKFGEHSIEDFRIDQFGPRMRWQPDFAPKGVNANFFEVREDSLGQFLRIRTFERGVEGETLACGTGAMSTAIVARLGNYINSVPVRLLTQSGEFVQVDFSGSLEKISNLSLLGSAKRLSEGTFRYDPESDKMEIDLGGFLR